MLLWTHSPSHLSQKTEVSYVPSLSPSLLPPSPADTFALEQHETHFNDLPLSSRISQTKLFVRDLTYLARGKEVDGWVLTGSSNVGRVLMLLIGEERLGGVRSLDTR